MESAGIDLCMMSATQLAEAIRCKQVSPVEVTQALLAALNEQNPRLNAFVTITGETALAEARRAEAAVLAAETLGPLHGVPVSLKDSFDLRGVPTTFGSNSGRQFIPGTRPTS